MQGAYTLSYTYTLSGHPKSVTDASGKTTDYHYNDLGQLTQVRYDGKLINDYGYDHYARLISQTYPNHLQTKYTYDEYNALATLTHQQLGKSTKVITKFAYTYNQDGNIQTRTRSSGQGEQAKESYTYDKDNNLTSYQCQGSLCPQDQRHNTIDSQYYRFDALNNIQSIQSSLTNQQGKVIHNTTTYQYSPVLPTRLIGYQNSDADCGNSPTLLYDKDGNMTEDDQHQLLTYDLLDRTQAIHKAGEDAPLVTYLYNGDNVQIGTQSQKQDATYFIYGQGQLANTQQGNNTTSYLYGGKQRLAKVENQNTTYYLTDQGQSVIHLVQSTPDNGPKVIASYAYSPYGIETTLSQASQNQATKRFGFDGQLTDPTTGWQFLGKGYRAYNPLLHRFMSQDSMSPFEKGGINCYVFAGNNPIMKFDPSGHVTLEQSLGYGVGIALSLILGAALSYAIPTFLIPKLAIDSLALQNAIPLITGTLVGSVSNGLSEYVGNGISTKSWSPNAQTGIAFAIGAAAGLATSLITLSYSKLWAKAPPTEPLESVSAPTSVSASSSTADTVLTRPTSLDVTNGNPFLTAEDGALLSPTHSVDSVDSAGSRKSVRFYVAVDESEDIPGVEQVSGVGSPPDARQLLEQDEPVFGSVDRPTEQQRLVPPDRESISQQKIKGKRRPWGWLRKRFCFGSRTLP